MTRVSFATQNGRPAAFTLKGHALSAEAGRDIVCAAVSSAVYMAANTITEILGADAAVEVKDAYFRLVLPADAPEGCDAVMRGLRLHLGELARQYPTHITILEDEDHVTA